MFLACIPAFPQAGANGTITGTVVDESGAAIPGATVVIQDVQRGTSRTLTTDQAGAYNAPNLVPGTYNVRVEYKGFKTVERQNVPLEVAGSLRIDLTMQPGEQTQVVNVTEAVPLIETTNAELGGTLQNQVINDLPLNGRNFENLLDLRPGVATYPGGSGWSNSNNGGRPHDNYFMVDGINSNDPWMAQSVMNAVMAAGDAGTILPIDAIDEFKTQQNPGAEYGWKPGAIVNIGVKSGSNMFHGTAYAYGRDGSWDALDYFTQPGAPVSPVALEQFGGSLGGPIKKDKLFFFGNFEEQEYSIGSPSQHNVPITAAGVGSASENLIGACNAANAAGKLTALSAQLAGLSTNCAPLSNYPGLFPANPGPTEIIDTSLATNNTIYSGLIRMDYTLNSKNSFNGMYFISPGSGIFVDNPQLEIAEPWLTNQYARSQVGSGSWTYVISSTTVNSFRAGYSHYYQAFTSGDSTQNPANYMYNGSTYHIYTGQTNPQYFGLPLIAFQGGYSFQLGLNWPKTVGPDGVYQISDGISVLHGRHNIKFGFDILVLQSTNDVTANTKGNPRFPNLEDFFEGDMNRMRYSAGDFVRHLQNQAYGAYVQDDWRILPRLTINLGLRYELNTVPTEDNNLLGNFSPTVGLEQVGMQIGSIYNGDHHNFAPRLGIAWDVTGNGKTVVRASGGIFYEQFSYDDFMALANIYGLRTIPTGVPLYTNGNPVPFTAGGTINVGAVSLTGPAVGNASTPGTPVYNWINNGPNNPLFSAAPACGDGTVTLPTGVTPEQCTILAVDRNLRTPYIGKWSMDVQRAITNNLSLDVAYVGNRGVKLLGLTDLNQPLPALAGGFSPGWGNPANPNSPAGQCLASATPTAGYLVYGNCNPDSNAEQAARPFNAKFPYLSYINWVNNDNFSTYNGLQVSMTQRDWHGLSYVLGYTWSHALGMSPDNWSYVQPIDSTNVRNLYGNTQFDITHRFTLSTTYLIPGRNAPLQLLRGWSVNGILTLETGLPWGVNDETTDFSGTGEIGAQATNGESWDFFGNPSDFQTTKAFINTNCNFGAGCEGGIPWSGTPGIQGFNPTLYNACLAKSQAMGALAVASLSNLGCYGYKNSILVPPAFGSYGTLGPNVFRGPGFYNLDFSVTKAIVVKERFRAQFRTEFFNIFNHPEIANPFGGPGGSNQYTDPSAAAGASFGFQPFTPDVVSSNPVLGSGGPRAIQLGLKLIF